MKLKLTTYILLAALVSQTGCKKFLDQKPISGLVEANYYRTTDEVETGVIACYDGLQKVYDIEYKLTELRSDNASGVGLEGDWGGIKFFRDSPSNFFLQDYWQRTYNTITRCNTVLKYLNNVTDANKKKYFEGEAKFIRALMYFNLVRLYGEVPLIAERIDYNDSDKFVKATKAAIYDQIKADLLKAVDSCPDTWATQKARATSGSSRALLAKVYVTLKDWANAKTQLEPLLGTNLKGTTYGLNASYAAIFSTASEMSKEIVFAVRYKSSSNGEGNSFSYEYTNSGDARYIKGTTAYQAMFESTDVRKATTFTTNALVGKFLDPSAPVRDAGNDVPVLRYADVLLLYAEALNELGTVPTAATIAPINEVRARASASLYTIATLATKDAVRDAIYKERQLEFGFENQRWYDLLRMDQTTTIAIMNAYFAANGSASVTVPVYRLIYPIPQTEIDLSSGKLKQNPGY